MIDAEVAAIRARIPSLFAAATGGNSLPIGVDSIHGSELERFADLIILECAHKAKPYQERLQGLEPLLYEVNRRFDKVGGDGDFTVTIDADMWEQIKDHV